MYLIHTSAPPQAYTSEVCINPLLAATGLLVLTYDNVESLIGVTPAGMAAEIESNATQWDFVAFAPPLSKHPLLLVTSDDGLAGASDALGHAVHKLGPDPVTTIHLTTDHSYSGKRIVLATAVISWLDGLPSR